MIDIVIPDKNEKAFQDMAEQLGIKRLIFLYEKKGKLIGKGKKEIIVWKAGDELRNVIEKSNVDIIFGLEEMSKADFLHHRGSGLNHVLAELIRKKKRIVGFSFSSLLRVNGTKRAQFMGRMQQNFRLCKKYKVETLIASFAKDPSEMRRASDLGSLFLSLGMEPGMMKKALESAKRFI